MKKILNIKNLLIVLLIFISSACEKNFLDINVDPNNPSSATVQLVFPAAVGSTAYVLGGEYQVVGGIWSQHWTQSTGASQYRDYDAYKITTTDFDNRQYGELYSGALNDLQYVKKLATKDENWTYYLMATVVQAFTFQILADLYDEIPFSEALKGDQQQYAPKFEKGVDVYKGLILMINDALSKDLTAKTCKTPGKDDVIFNGDMARWIQFANTLKLKIFMRQVYANPSLAGDSIKGMFNRGVSFLTTDAKFTPFADEQNRRNPVYETEVDRFGNINLAASKTLLDYLINNNDSRVDAIFNTPTKGGPHKGLLQGDYSNTSVVNHENLSQPALNALDPVYFISESECLFLIAEASLRGFVTSGNAKTSYENAVKASFAKMGLTDADSFLISGKPYEFPASGFENQLKMIMTQKWISMANSQGLEAFFEQNRTHYPDFFTTSVNSVWAAGVFPKRFLFPDSEYTRNPKNTPTLKRIYEKVWWDQK